MMNFVRYKFLQNFQNLPRIHKAAIAYQFKTSKPIYYPDRQIEMQRIKEQYKAQHTNDAPNKTKLPKDYYYKVLGISKHATVQQIKTAYNTLAKQFHPALHNIQHESKRFQEISNAYHILIDEAKRIEYDQLGTVKDEESFLKKVSNTYNKIANKKNDRIMAKTREDFITEPRLELTFLEAAHGVKKNVDLQFLKKCPSCNGKSTRLVNRKEPEVCRKCNGTGQLNKKTKTYTMMTTCDQCFGKRYINRSQCEKCDNRGFVLDTVKVLVQVPMGIKSGDLIAIDNPRSKQRVNYRVHVLESEYYTRSGNDIFTDKFVTISEAVFGGTFKVRGIYEDFVIKVDPGTESHTKFVMKGKGIKNRDGTGDHVITLKIRIPRTLSMKQRQLILALSKTEDPTVEG